MLRTVLIVIGVLLLSGTTATGMHSDASLPLLSEDERVETALQWLERFTTEDGCATYNCGASGNKWWTVTLAQAGIDPTTWPRAEASVLQWLLENADDLEEPSERDQCSSSKPHQTHQCQAARVHSVAKSILAFRAGGLDPSTIPLPGGGQRDFVDELLSLFQAGQFGFVGYVNDNIFAIIALNSIRYDGPELQQAIKYVEASQDPNGGVGWADGVPPSVDMTAVALMALGPHDRAGFTERALGFLQDTQVRSGDQRGCWPGISGHATASSTAWAVQGLVAAGEDPLSWSVNEKSPVDCLLDFQNPDGGFANSKRSGQDGSNPGTTQQVIAALSWIPYGASRAHTETVQLETTARPNQENPVTVPQGFLRVGHNARANVTVFSTSEKTLTHHGFMWDTFRPVQWVFTIAGLPAQPLIDAPQTAGHEQPFEVDTRPGNEWTRDVFLRLPDATVAEGGSHVLRLPGPATYTLEAWGTNHVGETGPISQTTVEIPHGALKGVDFLQAPSTTQSGEPVVFKARSQDEHGNPRPDPVTYGVENGPGSIDPSSGHYVSNEQGMAMISAYAKDPASSMTVMTTVPLEVLPPAFADSGFTWTCKARECTFRSGLDQKEDDERTPGFSWRLGDGQTAVGETVTHRYDEYGNYTVTLNVTDPNGITSEFTENVTVAPSAPVVSLKIAVVPAIAKKGETVEITANVKNKGDGALGNAKLQFKEGNATFHEESLPVIDPGHELDVTTPWTMADDTHTLHVTVPDHEASILFTLRASNEATDDGEDADPQHETETPKADMKIPRTDPWTGDEQETPGAPLLIAPLLVVWWIVVKRSRLLRLES